MTGRDDSTTEVFSVQLPATQWSLSTKRLALRPYAKTDAPQITKLVSRRDVSATTLHIPHPYPDGAAAKFIDRVHERYEKCGSLDWAICLRNGGVLIGGISLVFELAHHRAEIGYWIDPEKWGSGYATEASRAVLQLGFETIGLHKIDAHYFSNNPASGRVLENIGMQHEGRFRQHIFKWGEPLDIILCGILRSEYDSHPAD